MAIPLTNIPVLTGEVAKRFIEMCDYNAKNLAGSEWSQEREDRFKEMLRKQEERRRVFFEKQRMANDCLR